MYHNFSPDYDTDKKMREQELQRVLDHKNLVEQARLHNPPRRHKPAWRTFIMMIIGFFF